MRLTVDGQRFGKFLLHRFAVDVENVAAFRIAFEVDEVDNAFRVHSGLRLNAVIRCGDEFDVLACGEG